MGSETQVAGSERGSGEFVVGIDCSTTGVKALVVDSNGAVVGRARVGVVIEQRGDGLYEQDPEQWISGVKTALRWAIRNGDVEGNNVRAICVTNQREAFAVRDRRGNWVSNGILWLDSRAGEQAERLRRDDIIQATGRPADLTTALYKVVWLREKGKVDFREVGRVVDVQAVVIEALTGICVSTFACADSLGLVDIWKESWCEEALRLAGLERSQLSELISTGDVVGTVRRDVARELGIGAGCVVVGGVGDGQAGLVGMGVTRERARVGVNFGTALVVGCAIRREDAYGVDVAASGLRWMCGVERNTVIAEGLVRCGWFAVSWALSVCKGNGGAEWDERVAVDSLLGGRVLDVSKLFVVPYLEGSGSPNWVTQARGTIFGISGTTSWEDIVGATVAGLAYECRRCIELVEAYRQTRKTGAGAIGGCETVATGGGFGSKFVREVFANVCERCFRIISEGEACALGAAYIAGASSGFWGGVDFESGLKNGLDLIARSYENVEPKHCSRVAEAYERYLALAELVRQGPV